MSDKPKAWIIGSICSKCRNHGGTIVSEKKIDFDMAYWAYCNTCETDTAFVLNCTDMGGRSLACHEISYNYGDNALKFVASYDKRFKRYNAS